MFDKLLKFVGFSSQGPAPQDLESVVGFYLTKNTETGAETLSYRCPRRTVVEKDEETGKETNKVIGCGVEYRICGDTVPCCGKRETRSKPVEELPVVNVSFRRQQEGTAKVGNQSVIDTDSLPGQFDGNVVYDGTHPSSKIKDYDLGNTAIDSGLWGGGR